MKTVLLIQSEIYQPILSEKMSRLGYKIINFPLTRIEPLSPLKKELALLEHSDCILFVSPNAVTHCPSFTKKNDSQIIAIGKTTKLYLNNKGFDQVATPHTSISETLLTLPILKNCENKLISIVKGKKGRLLIQDTLKNRGALVNNIIVYQQIKLENMIPEHIIENIDSVLIKSSTNLTSLLNCNHSTVFLNKKLLLVTSDRLFTEAKQLGFLFVEQLETNP